MVLMPQFKVQRPLCFFQKSMQIFLWKIYEGSSKLHVMLDKDINWATRKRLKTTQDVRVKRWGWCIATWGKIPSSRCSLDSRGLIYRSRTICICMFMPPICSVFINGPNYVCCNSPVWCRVSTAESVAIFCCLFPSLQTLL